MTADDVLMTTGCQQALQLAVSLLAPPGSVVACEVPAYYALLELFGVAGVRVLPLYVRDEQGVDVAETVALLRMHRPKALFLCSSLSNPSGCTTAVDRRAQLAAACADLEIHLVEDDIYGELHEGGALPPASGMARHGGATYVSSFSKSLAPGLRVGFFASPRLAESAAVLKCQQDMHSAVGPEAVVRAFVQSGGFDTHLGWLRERNRERREFAAAVIADAFPAGCRLWKPNGGYMLWVDLPERTDMGTLAARCRDRGVVFAAGSVFFTTPQERPSVRLNCARATLDQLEMALRTLGSALRE
jgi:DNA-binding transcriptional MocR family regulator